MQKPFIRNIVDILMPLMFIIGLVGAFFREGVHIAIGCVFFALVLVHNLINANYYRAITNGKYDARRLANAAIIILFTASLSALFVTGAQLAFGYSSVNWHAAHMWAAGAAFFFMLLHLSFHVGRHMRGRRLTILTVCSVILASFGAVGLPYLDRWYHTVEADVEKIVAGEKVAFGGRVLTVYFSRVGNTKFPPDTDAVSGASVMRDGADGKIFGNAQMIAMMIHDAAGGDLIPIRTEKTYPANYSDTTNEAKREFGEGEYPALILPGRRLDDYDTIFVVYPLWWGTRPAAVGSFLRAHDLSGKNLVPVVTHGGGGAGRSVDDIRLETRARVYDALTVYSSDISSSRREIADYLKKIKKMTEK